MSTPLQDSFVELELERTSLFCWPWYAQLTLISVSKILRPLRVWRAVSAARMSLLRGEGKRGQSA